MKVRYAEDGFRPIIITLETEQEARAMWHLLNVPLRQFKEYVSEYNAANPDARLNQIDLKIPGLWEELNARYRPAEKYE